eukprot:scaffold29342_cov72-Skeletonema_dohrnii-CCMP3373.AAC.1
MDDDGRHCGEDGSLLCPAEETSHEQDKQEGGGSGKSSGEDDDGVTAVAAQTQLQMMELKAKKKAEQKKAAELLTKQTDRLAKVHEDIIDEFNAGITRGEDLLLQMQAELPT